MGEDEFFLSETRAPTLSLSLNGAHFKLGGSVVGSASKYVFAKLFDALCFPIPEIGDHAFPRIIINDEYGKWKSRTVAQITQGGDQADSSLRKCELEHREIDSDKDKDWFLSSLYCFPRGPEKYE